MDRGCSGVYPSVCLCAFNGYCDILCLTDLEQHHKIKMWRKMSCMTSVLVHNIYKKKKKGNRNIYKYLIAAMKKRRVV